MIRVLAAIAGVLLVILVSGSALRTVFVPRHTSSRAARASLRVVVSAGSLLADHLPRRSGVAVMAFCAPVAVLLTATCWFAGLATGFALLAAAVTGQGVGIAQFTRFIALRDNGAVDALTLVAWLWALMVLATFQTHLGRFTAAYSRRERLVIGLAAQARTPLDAERMLASHLSTGSRDSLDALFRTWVDWAADVKVTHTGYPALFYYTSSCRLAWFQAALIMMDAAAVVEAVAPTWAPPHAKALLDGGSDCLRTAAECVGVRLPDAVNTVSLHGREERSFVDTIRLAVSAGLPAEAGCTRSWHSFQQLRTRYAPYAVLLGARLRYDPTSAEDDDGNME